MRYTYLIILTVVPLFLSAQNQWTIKDSVNGAPRSVSSAFVADGEGYIVAGLDVNGFRRTMYSYTFWQDDWDDELSLGGLNGGGLNRGSASSFSALNKGYVCLGQGETNPFFYDLWEYDPATNAWTQKADFIGTPRRQAVAFSLNDIGYVGTGIDATGFKKDMFTYDPATNVWTQIGDFGGTARKEAVGFAMGGQAYVGTGDDGVKRNDFWQYEPTTDTWTQKTDFPGTPRKGAVGWGQFPSAFICTGEDNTFTYKKDLWEYNYFTNAWVQRADFMGTGRSNAIVFVLQDLAFVGTGYDGEFKDDMYAYRRIVGIEELQQNANVSIYPNPVENDFKVKSDLVNLELVVYDALGRNITNRLLISKKGKEFHVNRNGVEPGHYIIHLNAKGIGKVYDGKVIFV